ncbi:hypothetical protein A2765_01200 [Candidatus Kaiserbacteria bacterium RIFCSPHIGHO2_01_FULL_56_24]|uniref:Uncharacterized protein n=1 Tax=Candidatus Kaiserbacteria bacterium RIFCSPHIGHO2_01_FULL_56_24 TaxID=1798487 RepID=A0A1F6DCU6_9BACT|nr:MAG: hypothetical protein A2765_01200 [Candidatus Kaiserbacteria bacterium RIFCSPHIGHO2_01_FULL_56_24]
MQKDFDRWNKEKKHLHGDGGRPFYHVREIWWCAVGTNIGFEKLSLALASTLFPILFPKNNLPHLRGARPKP